MKKIIKRTIHNMDTAYPDEVKHERHQFIVAFLSSEFSSSNLFLVNIEGKYYWIDLDEMDNYSSNGYNFLDDAIKDILKDNGKCEVYVLDLEEFADFLKDNLF